MLNLNLNKLFCFLTTILLFSFNNGLYAQNDDFLPCGTTDESFESMKAISPTLSSILTDNFDSNHHRTSSFDNDEIIQVPIVFHIVDKISGEHFVTEDKVLEGLKGLNDRFRGVIGDSYSVDTKIEFVLAKRDPQGNCTNGINYIDASHHEVYVEKGVVFGVPGAGTAGIKDEFAWPDEDYFQVWVYWYHGPPAGAALPIQPLNDYGGVGISEGGLYYIINTLTHEAGHFLSLRHTQQGAPVNGCAPNDDPENQGDFVCDTPPVGGYPCGESTTPCYSEEPVYCNGVLVEDYWNNAWQNYMSYCISSSTDITVGRFTQGQKERMRASFDNVDHYPYQNGLLLQSDALLEPVEPEYDITTDLDTYCPNQQIILNYLNIPGPSEINYDVFWNNSFLLSDTVNFSSGPLNSLHQFLNLNDFGRTGHYSIKFNLSIPGCSNIYVHQIEYEVLEPDYNITTNLNRYCPNEQILLSYSDIPGPSEINYDVFWNNSFLLNDSVKFSSGPLNSLDQILDLNHFGRTGHYSIKFNISILETGCSSTHEIEYEVLSESECEDHPCVSIQFPVRLKKKYPYLTLFNSDGDIFEPFETARYAVTINWYQGRNLLNINDNPFSAPSTRDSYWVQIRIFDKVTGELIECDNNNTPIIHYWEKSHMATFFPNPFSKDMGVTPKVKVAGIKNGDEYVILDMYQNEILSGAVQQEDDYFLLKGFEDIDPGIYNLILLSDKKETISRSLIIIE